MKLMKLHEELDKSIEILKINAEHRKHFINESKLLSIIADIDKISTDLYLLKGTK